MEDIRKKPLLGKLTAEHFFERYVVLWNRPKAGWIHQIFDGRGTCLYEDGEERC